MKRIEALADAIAEYSGYKDPTNKLYKLRNPGGLKGFKLNHVSDSHGYRLFDSHIDGYNALLYDLNVKCKGESSCGLKTESPLKELAYVFDMKDDTVRYVVSFLRKALMREDLKESFPLSFFLE